MSQLISSPIRRNFFISRHFYVTDAMTIVTHGNEILKRSVLPIPINVMNNQHPFVRISTVIASFFKNSPSISPVRSWHLSLKRIFIPLQKLAGARTENPSISSFLNSIWSYFKRFTTLNTYSIYSRPFRSKRTLSRTKPLRLCRMFFRDKLSTAKFTNVFNDLFSSINPTAFIAASNISMGMTCRDEEGLLADGTRFINFFHGEIIT